MCVCRGRQDLDRRLVSKQAGGQRGSAALKDAMANWMTASSQVCMHSLIPEGGWRQTWGQGYSLLHLGSALNSTYQTLKQDKSKHITCQAMTRLLFILRPIMKCFIDILFSNLPSQRGQRPQSATEYWRWQGQCFAEEHFSMVEEWIWVLWLKDCFSFFFYSEWFLLRSTVEQPSDSKWVKSQR